MPFFRNLHYVSCNLSPYSPSEARDLENFKENFDKEKPRRIRFFGQNSANVLANNATSDWVSGGSAISMDFLKKPRVKHGNRSQK